MEKNVTDFLLKRLTLQKQKLEEKNEFFEAYVPLAKQRIEDEMKRKLERIDDWARAKLEPYAIAAGKPDATTLKKKEEEKETLEDRYAWKEKALRQTYKRKKDKHPEREEQLGEELKQKQALLRERLQKKLRTIEETYAPDQEKQAISETAYKEKKESVEVRIAGKKSKIRSKAEDKKSSIEEKYQKKIEKTNKRIEKLEGWKDRFGKNKTDDAISLPDDVLLRLDQLSMRFGGLLAVNELTFDVKHNEIFGLIGPNGAGKTTVFNCLTRFYMPSGGDMYYRTENDVVINLKNTKVHNIVKQNIARTFQNVELIWELSVLDNLLVAAHTHIHSNFFHQLFHTKRLKAEEDVMRKKATGILEDLGLIAYKDVSPYGLPYGIMKRIELARTLMMNPRMIILDEPAAGLNDKETDELEAIIRKIRDDYDATIFLVEHDMGLVMDICDTVCAISFGKKLAIGTPAEIQANQDVRSAYLGEGNE